MKPKITLFMAISANGFIARADGSVAWSVDEFANYTATVRVVGALIIGRKTYELMRDAGEFDGMDGVRILIVSRTLQDAIYPVVADVDGAMGWFRENDVDHAILGGGTILNSAFVRAGLVDEIHLDVEPVLFDNGIPLLLPDTPMPTLELLSATPYGGGGVGLRYRVKN